jgi:hypothetical protein
VRFLSRSFAGTLLVVLGSIPAFAQAPEFAHFRTQEIDTKLTVGYAVLLVDVNHDGKKDIVVVDTNRVIWYENPTWKMRTIIQGATKPDNVCIDAYDIDGDGLLDFALGADWKPFNTKDGGTLQWLKRGKTLDEPWTVHPIDTEPTVHRIRFADVDGDGKAELVSVPLMGKGSTPKNNWQDGEPVRIIAYRIPKDPTKDRWTPEIIDHGLRVIHNFQPVPGTRRGKDMEVIQGMDLITASYEGVHHLARGDGGWLRRKLGTGNQETPQGKRGASEIKLGKLKSKFVAIATIEPWHGDQVVVYTKNLEKAEALWDRRVVDDELKWGHAVWFADLDGDGGDELIVGVRDDGGKKRRGVRVYKAMDAQGAKWSRQLVDPGGVAVEDLAAADLDGDGRVDIVAVGRATKNVRIYWNQGNK